MLHNKQANQLAHVYPQIKDPSISIAMCTHIFSKLSINERTDRRNNYALKDQIEQNIKGSLESHTHMYCSFLVQPLRSSKIQMCGKLDLSNEIPSVTIPKHGISTDPRYRCVVN